MSLKSSMKAEYEVDTGLAIRDRIYTQEMLNSFTIHRDIGYKAECEIGELRRIFWAFLHSILAMDSSGKA